MDQKKEGATPMYLQICTILHGAALATVPPFPPALPEKKAATVLEEDEKSRALVPLPT